LGQLVFADTVIDPIGPRVNSTRKVPHLIKTCFVKQLHGLGAAWTHLANCDNLLIHIEFIHAARQLGQRNKVSPDI
jgi:hypothetical protein